ncbi:MAG: aminotransferase class I/II-fold pyridoxal phosphate-dependent enzyme, partial [Oscillospiraceae bacterium]
ADTALVYVDNPNNPTGQTMPLAELERIVARARALDVYVLVDEAYGDFIPPEESILSRWGYDKLLVTRTFSKGFGLAGLRAGYIVADPTVIGYLSKISNPYMMNELTREVVAAALEEPTHPMAHCGEFARVKETIRRQIGKNLTLLHTDDRVPICTLCHRNPEANLQRLLYANGILTVSGIDFDGLACNCVRLRVPREEAAQRLVDAIRQVEAH